MQKPHRKPLACRWNFNVQLTCAHLNTMQQPHLSRKTEQSSSFVGSHSSSSGTRNRGFLHSMHKCIMEHSFAWACEKVIGMQSMHMTEVNAQKASQDSLPASCQRAV